MNGKQFRLARFLSRSEKLVVAAIDHGIFHGPMEGLENSAKTCTQLTAADAVLMPPGTIQHVAQQFTGPTAPLLIVRLVWNSAYCSQWGYNVGHHRPLLTVAQAVAKGADLVLASLALDTGSEQVDTENIGIFSQFIQQAGELGIPIIGELYPGEMAQEDLHKHVKIGCRIMAELGADMIKTFYTGPRFNEIVETTPIPILILGAKKTPTERDALMLAATATRAGARGILFGRNIFQSRSPAGFIKAVKAVINNQCDVDQAVKELE